MGIQGLIPFLQQSAQSTNVKNFAGSTVAIDAYCWLYKGAFFCADKLAKGESTNTYVLYCIKRLNMLRNFGVKPIMVFDGKCLPSKSETEAKRRQTREKNRNQAKIFLQEGNLDKAKECFQRCLDVTPEMAQQVIVACKEMEVDCIVAPYEADAQLAYLNLIGIAQLIITEDSDLLLFGCERVLFKMDSKGGGMLIEKRNIHKSLGAKAASFTFEKFRYSCIMSGCDYLPSLPGIGPVRAFKFFSLITNPDLNLALSKIPTYLKMPKLTNLVTKEYKDGFVRAVNTFLYQLVFCPMNRKLVPLNPYPKDVSSDNMEYAGKYFPNDVALEIAMGKVNCFTMKPFLSTSSSFRENKIGVKKHNKFPSIWDPSYQPNKTSVKVTATVNLCTKGKALEVNTGKIFTKWKSPKKRGANADNEFKIEVIDLVERDAILSLYTPTATKRSKVEFDDGNYLKNVWPSPEKNLLM